jgi:uncharacterized protein (TIGR02145 family)
MMTKKSVHLGFVSIILLLSCESDIDHPYYVGGDGVTDSEGNTYKTVVIGNQEWMAENLKTDLYCNGDSIQYSGADVRVKVYDNDIENEAVFGKLYNYQAVLDTSGLCPCDWHVPTELEYAVLINYLGGFQSAMRKMKASGSLENENGLWSNPNDDYVISGANVSGFDALPAGRGFYASFDYKDVKTSFWALPTEGTDAVEFGITNGLPYVDKQRHTQIQAKEVFYYSVRCIKNL